MRCPYCESEDHKVVDKRTTPDGHAIRRRRECLSCGKRFTSHERVQTIELYVIKKDKTRQSFDREKLFRGVRRACDKRPVSVTAMTEIVDHVEKKMLSYATNEISSRKIGDLVMKRLKQLDEVAYVRFASVYRSFKDVDDFSAMLHEVKKKKS